MCTSNYVVCIFTFSVQHAYKKIWRFAQHLENPIIHLYIPISISLVALLFCLPCFCLTWLLLYVCTHVLGSPVLSSFSIPSSGSLTMTQQPTFTQQILPLPPVKWQTRLSRMDWCRLHVSAGLRAAEVCADWRGNCSGDTYCFVDALAYSITHVEPHGFSKLSEKTQREWKM